MNGLTHYTPLLEMDKMRGDFNRLFEDIFTTRRASTEQEAESAVWAPRADVAETEDEYVLSLDVPGVNKNNINISYQENAIVVSGERRVEEGEDEPKRNYFRVERVFGHFYRSFRLPKAVEADSIQAQFENGVLTIHVPKAMQSKPKRIEIR